MVLSRGGAMKGGSVTGGSRGWAFCKRGGAMKGGVP